MVDQLLIRSRCRVSVVASDRKEEFPVLRLQTGVLFPGSSLTIRVSRPENARLVDACMADNREFVAAYSPFQSSHNDIAPIHQVGVFATIRDRQPGRGDAMRVTVEGLRRAYVDGIVSSDPYLLATANDVQLPKSVSRQVRGQVESVFSVMAQLIQLDPTYSPELMLALKSYSDDPAVLADQIAAAFHFPLASKQELLEAVPLRVRYDLLLEALNAELFRANGGIAPVDARRVSAPSRSVGPEFASSGTVTDGGEDEAVRVRERLRKMTGLPPEAINRIKIEIDRMSRLSAASAEYGVAKNYLDWVLSLPWGKTTPVDYDIKAVEKVIQANYFGPATIKEHILQRLSVRRLMGGVGDGPTLCLVGASGTGKASLAKAIAKSLGKELIRISVGGISDVSEFKGEPPTFLRSQPGKLIRSLREAKTCDPVVLIEDIDAFNLDNKASLNMAVLEAVDSRWNSRFQDSYLGVPFDLSKALFICAVRSFEELPEQFLTRFEILEVPGYIEREKITIARRYILPSLLKKHGILRSEVRMGVKTLSRIISDYTQEAGLLQFSQQIEKICRRIALEKAEKRKTSWTIAEKNIEVFLGPALFIPEKAEMLPEIGTAAGLAWTGAGGDLMFIEGLKMKGEGQIITTGSLGEVMKESIQAAHSYVRSKADMLGIDFTDFNEFDVHIHFPSGAIPKDGPSAGVAVCLVIASVMAERPIRNDIAMTGEVTLRGKVLPVGGIKEKASAAYRAGIHHVVLPKENKKDIKELPREIQRKMKFSFIERVDELFEVSLMDFTPSSFTLEKIFAEEIERAKSKKPKKTRPRKKDTGKAARPRKK